MDHQTLQLALTMEKLDNALAKLQEIQCTLRGHRSSGIENGDQKQRLRCNDGWVEKVRSAPSMMQRNSRGDVLASMEIAKKTVDMMKVQRTMLKNKQSTSSSPPLRRRTTTCQEPIPITLLHPCSRLNLPDLDMEPLPPNGSSGKHAAFAHHLGGQGQGQGQGHENMESLANGTNVARSSKENKNPARKPHRSDSKNKCNDTESKVFAERYDAEGRQRQEQPWRKQEQEKWVDEEEEEEEKKKKKKKKKPCDVKRRFKEPLDMVAGMPPSFCVQVEEVKAKSSRRRRNSWGAEKEAIVMFPNPTFDRNVIEERRGLDKTSTEKKTAAAVEEKMVRLAPCHHNNSVGKVEMDDTKEGHPAKLVHPIRDSIKRTKAFIKAFSSMDKREAHNNI